jgi:hypothetical protein
MQSRLLHALRSACLATAVVTAWGAAPASATSVDAVGTISPTVQGLTDVYLLYGTNCSGSFCSGFAVRLPDAPAGVATPFDVPLADAGFGDQWMIAAGVPGPTQVGATFAAPGPVGSPWVFSTSEVTIAAALSAGDTATLASWFQSEAGAIASVGFGSGGAIVDFSNGVANGTAFADVVVVPEPETLALVAFGSGLLLLRRRR